MSGSGERPPLYVVHHHPGRLRLRSELLEDEAWCAHVQRAAEALEGLRKVSFGRHSGSVLLEYEVGRCTVDQLVDAVAAALEHPELRDWDTDPARRVDPAASVVRAAETVDHALRVVSGERVGLAEVVPAAMLVGAVLSARSGEHTLVPRWDNLVMWSYSVFAEHYRRRQARVDAKAE